MIYNDLPMRVLNALSDELVYIGRCRDSFKKRFNTGYGNISPKNCYKDGQATNCKINAYLCKYKPSQVKLKVFPMTDNTEIEKLEKKLFEAVKFENEYNNLWNA